MNIAAEEVSALHQVRYAQGYIRFVYGIYLILGVVFYGIAIYTALSALMFSLNYGVISLVWTVQALCYVLINGFVGYGFVFYKRWILTVFLTAFILVGSLVGVLYIDGAMDRVAGLLIGVAINTSILLFLFITRRILTGEYLESRVMVPFMGALLVSLLLTNISVIH